MTPSDHHVKFDSATRLKLEILEDYLLKWLPVFINNPWVSKINIIDLFSGPGEDTYGQKGSPGRIFSLIEQYIGKAKGKTIRAFFNDIDPKKFKKLENYAAKHCPQNMEAVVQCGDYLQFFNNNYKTLKAQHTANFLFIDPFGILGPEIFPKIAKLSKTDFIFFIPAHFISRFGSTEEFLSKWPCLGSIDKKSTKEVTNSFTDQCLSPHFDKDYLFASFTMKKKSGHLHGIIFGTKHCRGLEKFLEACWDKDPNNGTANYGLEGDLPIAPGVCALPGMITGRKLRNFQEFLKNEIISKRVETNIDIYYLTLKKACLPKHARGVLRELKKNGIVNNSVSVTWEAIKSNKIQQIELTE